MANFAKISQAAKLHPVHQDATEDKYEIKAVRIVPGSSLNCYWKNDMQEITTDKGKFIDKLPVHSGYDWKQEIGKMVTAKVSKDKYGNEWLNLCESTDKTNLTNPVRMDFAKEDLPPGYDINDNLQLKQAYDYIRQDVPVIFLTGGAGTGKSTFIKYLKNNLRAELNKNYVVLAPTGIAAINVGGQTIHSFFKFKTDVFDDKEIKKIKKNPVLDHTDLIIIDEISMVHSWMLDHIDYALRLWCDKDKPFGGKQMLLIGDCFQLPPVVDTKKVPIAYIKQWESPFFFAAKKLITFKSIQLKKIYRQNDRHFINILNRIRERKTGYERDIKFLNEKCFIETRLGTKNIPKECPLLCTTNPKVDAFNNEELNKLKQKGEKSITFEAFIQGEFDPKKEHVLTPESLKLCVGAKIMVTKNIGSQNLVNGDMGIVLDFGGTGNSHADDYVVIEVKGQHHRITRETWEIPEYKWDEETKTIKQYTKGSFTQIPLTYGWAITIHKSQGLTLNFVAIDADDAKNPGQIYVALSRAKSLDGILLCKEIPPSVVKIDEYVVRKYKELFPSENEETPADIENDYNVVLSNDGLTIDKSEKKAIIKSKEKVTIGGVDFDLYPNETQGEKIGAFVRRTLPLLLENNLIPDAEMKRLLTDKEYCYNTFGIITKTGFKYKLLGKNKQEFYDALHNQYKCWLKGFPKSGYYICSQWWKTPCTEKFAQWLIDLSEGKFSAPYIQIPDDSYTEEGIDWAKKKQEEKEKNFDAYLKQKKELEQERIRKEQNLTFSTINRKQTEIIKNPIIRKEEKPIETLEGKRSPVMQDSYVKFILADGSFILANDKGMKNGSLPWTGKMLRLKVFKKEEGKITEWSWEEA